MIATQKKLYSVREVAEMFGVDRSRIQALISGERIEGAQFVGSNWVIQHGARLLPPKSRTAIAYGPIGEYVTFCGDRGVNAVIPPHEWWDRGEATSYEDRDRESTR